MDDDFYPNLEGAEDRMEFINKELEQERDAYAKKVQEAQTVICKDLSEILCTKEYGGTSLNEKFNIQTIVKGALPLESVQTGLQNMKFLDAAGFQIAIASSGFTDPEFCKKLIKTLQAATTREDAISILRVALETECLIARLPVSYHPTPTRVGDDATDTLQKLLASKNKTPDEKVAAVAEMLAPELQQFLLFPTSDPKAFRDVTIEMSGRPPKTKTEIDYYADTLDSSAVPISSIRDKLSWVTNFFGVETVTNLLINLVETVKAQLGANQTLFNKEFAQKIVQDLQTFVLEFSGIKSGIEFGDWVKYRQKRDPDQKLTETMVIHAGARMVDMAVGDFWGRVTKKLADKLISHLREQKDLKRSSNSR